MKRNQKTKTMRKALLRTGIICLLYLITATTIFAQQLTPTVVSSGGESFTGNNLLLDFTIGEITTETLAANGSSLTQGFLQGPDSNTGIEETVVDQKEIVVYPNPATDRIYLLSGNKEVQPLKTIIKDIQGRTVQNLEFDTNPLMERLDGLTPGFYTVTIEFNNHQSINKKVIKQ